MGLLLADPDDRMEPQLVAAMWAVDQAQPDVHLTVQVYKRSTQKCIAGRPLGRIVVSDPSIRHRRRRRRPGPEQETTCYRAEDYWNVLDSWGLLTAHWRAYWRQRQRAAMEPKQDKPDAPPVVVEDVQA